MTLAVAWIVASGALAAWAHVRFASRAPQGWWVAAAHVGLSLLFMSAVVPSVMIALIATATPVGGVVAVVGVALPGLTYLFLASFWLLNLFGSALSSRLR